MIGTDFNENNNQNFKIDRRNCPDIRTIDCTFDAPSTALTAITIGILIIYCGLWGWYMAMARIELYKRSYHRCAAVCISTGSNACLFLVPAVSD